MTDLFGRLAVAIGSERCWFGMELRPEFRPEYGMEVAITRPDTQLSQSRADGQGLYLRLLDHLGRSGEAKSHKIPKKVKCDGPMEGPTDGPTDGRTNGLTKRGAESHSTRLKML